jgi:hypothetical protein
MNSKNTNAWQRFLVMTLLLAMLLSLSAFRGQASPSGQEEDPYLEIVNETDTSMCLFGAVPEGVTEVSDEHIFAEEELEPGDDFWLETGLQGTFTLIATDCDEYTIVAEAPGVILGQVPVVWWVGDEVEYLGEIEQAGAVEEEDAAEETAETEATGTADSEPAEVGAGAVDSGFRPESNGFNFENYGDNIEVQNLTAVEMQRLFGDQVCASQAGGECILTPPAKQWMQEINNYMAGGHCEGMAVLSLLMYSERVDPGDFGASSTHDLPLTNEALQREIALWWATQATWPAASVKINESPQAVVDALIETYTSYPAPAEEWVMGIYMSDFSGGHAITPFAIEDVGGGIYNILVYDNNWPDQSRVVEVDYDANTWRYQASTNPNEPESLYEGDQSTQTLELVGINQRMVQQDCDFCAGGGSSGLNGGTRGLAAPAQEFNQIWLNGQADLKIVTEDGQRIGFFDGEFINEIEGARGDNMKFGVDIWDINNEPVYYIPVGIQFSITVDASRATEGITNDVVMIGPGYDMVVAELYLDPGTEDTITISPDGTRLAYSTEYNDAPDMIFGVETPAADYEFIVAALDIESGAEFIIELDMENGSLNINTDNTAEYGVYEIVMYRVDDEGESWFQNDDIYMEPGDTSYFQFGEWVGPGSSLFVDIDYGSDGSIDESIELVDEYDG